MSLILTQAEEKAMELRNMLIGMITMQIELTEQLKSNRFYSKIEIINMLSDIQKQKETLLLANDIATGIKSEHQL